MPWEGRIHRETGTCLAQSLPTPLVTEVAIPEVVLADGAEQGTSSSPGMLDWARRAGTPPTTATAQGLPKSKISASLAVLHWSRTELLPWERSF